MTRTRLSVFFGIIFLIATFFIFDFQQYFSLEILKAQQASIELYRSEHPVLAVLVYLLIYIAVTALSLPGATLLT